MSCVGDADLGEPVHEPGIAQEPGETGGFVIDARQCVGVVG
ncbi:MAG: hypothetical protein RXR20_26680 [Paraburkholderia sp.]